MSDELKPQSIRTLEFANLMNAWRNADILKAPAAYDALIAHIDAWGARLAGAPDGWKLVPIEPTEDMCMAGVRLLWMKGDDQATRRDAEQCWQAMIDASPTPEDACGS
jgi:hypothetical protein